MHNSFFKLFVILFALLTLTACSVSMADPALWETGVQTEAKTSTVTSELAKSKPLSTAKSFGEFTTVDTDGTEVNESAFAEHKLTMVNVWATFCPPCINEMPYLADLADAFGDDFAIIGIISDVMYDGESVYPDDGLAGIAKIVKHAGAEYPQLLLSESIYDDTPVGQAEYVPTTFFVDSEGKLVGKSVVGGNSKKQWYKIIDARLTSIEK